MNKGLLEEFKQMSLEELKEFVEANDQPSFEHDSKVRILLNKNTPLGECKPGYNITFALTEMYIALAHALYERLNDAETALQVTTEAFALVGTNKASDVTKKEITEKAREFVKLRGLDVDTYWLDNMNEEELTNIIDEGESWFNNHVRETTGHYPCFDDSFKFRSELRKIREKEHKRLKKNRTEIL